MSEQDKAREAFDNYWISKYDIMPTDQDHLDNPYIIRAYKAYQAAIQANVEKLEAIRMAGHELEEDLMNARQELRVNKEVLREVLGAMENTDYHHDLFMQVSDCKGFCQEERLMQLGNLLQACEDQNKAIAKLKDMINEGE